MHLLCHNLVSSHNQFFVLINLSIFPAKVLFRGNCYGVWVLNIKFSLLKLNGLCKIKLVGHERKRLISLTSDFV